MKKLFRTILKQKPTIMETIERTDYAALLTATPAQVEAAVKETIEVLKAKAEFFDWEVTLKEEEILPRIEQVWKNGSLNDRKRLCRSIRRANLKKTRRAFNYMLSKVGGGNVKLGAKELEIQRKRKAWKELQAKAEEALLAYKSEKGDYYKKRLKN